MSENVKHALFAIACFSLAFIFLGGLVTTEAGGLPAIGMLVATATFAHIAVKHLMQIKESAHVD